MTLAWGLVKQKAVISIEKKVIRHTIKWLLFPIANIPLHSIYVFLIPCRLPSPPASLCHFVLRHQPALSLTKEKNSCRILARKCKILSLLCFAYS